MSQTILMTGANGGVGSLMRPLLRQRYRNLVLSDREEVADLDAGETFRPAQLGNIDDVLQAVSGADAVIHLGGQATEASWDVIQEANINGLFNIFEACRVSGVERFVFASSNHAVGMYSRQRRIGGGDKVRPDTRYGLSKAIGEAMGSLYADKHGMRVLSIRIGNVANAPADHRRLSIWIHPEDLMQLVVIGLEHPDLHNEIVFGASDNERSWWDNSTAFKLGYRPAHRAEDHAINVLEEQKKIAPDPVGDRLQGGGFASDEFSGDLDRTLNN